MKDYFFFFLFFHVWFFYILFQIQISWSNYELMIRINRWCLKRLNILKGVHISNLKNFWCKFETISTNQIFQRIKHAHIYILFIYQYTYSCSVFMYLIVFVLLLLYQMYMFVFDIDYILVSMYQSASIPWYSCCINIFCIL